MYDGERTYVCGRAWSQKMSANIRVAPYTIYMYCILCMLAMYASDVCTDVC